MKGPCGFVALFFVGLAFLSPAHAEEAQGPRIQEIKSPGGVKAWLVEDHKLPLLSVRFAFRGGVETDPADKQGLATLMMALLTQGAGPYDSLAFQDRLAERSIQLSLQAGRDALTGRMKTLTRTRDEAFHLLALALTSPRFDVKDIDREREGQIAAIRFQLSSPSWQARYALYHGVFGEHPYAYRSLGSSASLARIARDDITAFARAHLAKDNLLVSVVGDITPQELRVALDRMFGALPVHATAPAIAPVVWPQKGLSIGIDRQGTQTNVFWVAPMIRRNDPDWQAAQVANYILGGGGFESRLMKAVRMREGLTYGVGTSLAPMDAASMLVGQMATDNTKAVEAKTLIQLVWRDLVERGASEDEVDVAKSYLKGSWPLTLNSTDAIASTLLGMQQEKLGIDYLRRLDSLIDRVTCDDVNRVLKETFDPAHISFSYVGQIEGFAPDRTLPEVKD